MTVESLNPECEHVQGDMRSISLGAALLSLAGHGDRLRMHCLLADLNCGPTKTGVSFTWEGA